MFPKTQTPNQTKPAAKKFRERYTVFQRMKIVKTLREESGDYIVVVIEKEAKCPNFQSMSQCILKVNIHQSVHIIEEQLRKKMVLNGENNISQQSLYVFTANHILQSGEKMVDVYTKYRNELDDILYLSFSSIEPF